MAKVALVVVLVVACNKPEGPPPLESNKPPAELVINWVRTDDGKTMVGVFTLYDAKLGPGSEAKMTRGAGTLVLEWSSWPGEPPQRCSVTQDVTAVHYRPQSHDYDIKAPIEGTCTRPPRYRLLARAWLQPSSGPRIPASLVAIPKAFGGDGSAFRDVAEEDFAKGASVPPVAPPDAAEKTEDTLDAMVAEIAGLVSVVPEPTPARAPVPCSEAVARSLRLVDYDLARSLTSGQRLDQERQALSAPMMWELGRAAWGETVDRKEIRGIIKNWATPYAWAFVRTAVFKMPTSTDRTRFESGVLVGAIFVIDPATKKLVCHAPLVALSSEKVSVTSTWTDEQLREDFRGRVGEAARKTLEVLGAPRRPVLPDDE